MVSARSFALLAIYLVSSSTALPIRHALRTREVPQEHSHEAVVRATNAALKIDNPDNIQDAVFGLLGNAAASAGAGKITDPDCLQTATADRAFTNAKAAGDVVGMTAALQYRALERNTGQVGLKSVLCTSFKPVNPEIAAITQHQDPASEGAAATNKAIVLELAKQIAAIGGDPQAALQTGTFQPGDVNDATAKGNTCDDANDAVGCIISQNLIVLDATADEINSAVAGISADSGNTGTDCTTVPVTITVTVSAAKSTPTTVALSTSSSTSSSTSIRVVTTTSTSTPTSAPATTPTATPSSGNNNNGGSTTNNLQVFSKSLGGVEAPTVTANGNQFQVEGNSSFNNLLNALVRSCDVQNNKCANASNAAGQAKTFSVSDCNAQQAECIAQANSSASN